MVLKDVRAKVEQTWTTTKKILAAMSAWGLIFSLVTIARLGVAFGYDDVLVDSSASYALAAKTAPMPRNSEYWATINKSYDVESPKILPYGLALFGRALGFRTLILAERPAVGGDALKKEWRRLAPRAFVFVPDPADLHLHLQDGRYVLFLGSSDRDILESRRAGVYAVRVKRGKKAVGNEEYNPGQLGEIVLPWSEY
jgi:acid phosphatase class B